MKMIRNRSSGNHSSLTTDWMLALCVVLLCHDRGVTSFHLSLSLSRSLSLWLSSNHLRIGFFVCTSSRVRRVFSNRTICQYSRAKGNDKKPRTVCERIPQCTTVTASHSHCSQVAFGLSSLPWTWTWNNSLLLLHVGFFCLSYIIGSQYTLCTRLWRRRRHKYLHMNSMESMGMIQKRSNHVMSLCENIHVFTFLGPDWIGSSKIRSFCCCRGCWIWNVESSNCSIGSEPHRIGIEVTFRRFASGKLSQLFFCFQPQHRRTVRARIFS